MSDKGQARPITTPQRSVEGIRPMTPIMLAPALVDRLTHFLGRYEEVNPNANMTSVVNDAVRSFLDGAEEALGAADLSGT